MRHEFSLGFVEKHFVWHALSVAKGVRPCSKAISITPFATLKACHTELLAAVAVIALCAAASTCFANDRGKLSAQYAAEEKAFRAAVNRIEPWVVRLETIGGLQRAGKLRFGDGPTTGLIVDGQGHIVSSSFNFLRKPDSIIVQMADGSRKAARLLGTDNSRKLVLLKIELDDKAPIDKNHVPEMANKKNIRVGQWAIAVGRTFPGNRPNISVGIVSAVNRIQGKAIQTDAATSPNNYGGPLIDIHGRVMGLLTPLSPQSNSQTTGFEWYDSGIGFAIPAADVLRSVELMKKGQ